MQEELTALENELRALGRITAFPPTPPLASAVRSRLPAPDMLAPRPASAWALAAVALAALAVLLAAIVATAAPARDAIADLFHRIHIYETSEPLTGLPQDIRGTPITMDQVPGALGAPALLPAYPDGIAPERILLQDFGRVKAVAFFFHDQDGTPFVLLETNGLVAKGIARGSAPAERISGVGQEAWWLEGWRVVSYEDTHGQPGINSARATNLNTLVWAQNRLVLRVEGNLSREEAIRIAQSVR